MPDSSITKWGARRRMPSPDSVQNREITSSVVIDAERSVAMRQEKPNVKPAERDIGGGRLKKSAARIKSGMQRIRVGTSRIARALENQCQ